MVLGAFCAALSAGCATAQHSPAHRTDTVAYGAYLRGLMSERSGQLAEALAAYQEALRHDRRSPLLHVRIGAVQVKQGDMAQAQQAFSKALAVAPNHPEALRWMAMLQAAQGHLAQATETYERLVMVEPADGFILSTLADLYVLQGQLPRAVEVYERLIRETEPTSQLHFNLGVLYGRMAQFPDALQELSRAFELAPESIDVRVALGLTYELSGNYPQAAAHYDSAVDLDPLNTKLYHHAARAHFSGKQYQAAATNYLAALDLNHRDLEAAMGLIRVRIAQQRYDDAAQFIGKQLHEFEDAAELYIALGIVYREAKQPEEALRAFERATSAKPDYAQAHFYLAAALDQLGRKPAARFELRRTLALDANHADAMNYLGYLDAEAGVNLDEARTLIARALELDPENGAYLDSLGWVYYKMGKLDQAIRFLEDAAAHEESDPVVFDHLGEAHFARGHWDDARRHWQRALELDPGQVLIQEKLNRLMQSQAGVTP